LEKRGHFVLLAANRRAALTAFEEQSFYLLLIDLQMPEMDGFEATTAIRAKKRNPPGSICQSWPWRRTPCRVTARKATREECMGISRNRSGLRTP
jgi:CheY-like chemotaxis protein